MKSVQKEPTVERCLLILNLKPFRSYVKGKHSIGKEFQILAMRLGLFTGVQKSFMRLAKPIFSINFRTALWNNFFISLCPITLLLICGDVESNHGHKKTKICYHLALSQQNLNSITAHNFSKILMLKAYNVYCQLIFFASNVHF